MPVLKSPTLLERDLSHTSRLQVKVLTGAAASALIEDPGFRQRWTALSDRCPWSTVFQTHDFVCPWYRVFATKYTSVVVTASDDSGELEGLLTLAWSNDSKELLVAGTHHAEYQAWLSTPEASNAFIEAALKQLQQQFPAAGSLRFLYLPPLAPLDWIAQGRAWSKHCELVPESRPLMTVGDGSQFAAALAKKRYRARINRLNQIGPLCFEQILDPDELERIFDELVTLCDFRHGAAHGTLPFRNNSFKQPLYLALARVPGLLNITVLKLGDKIISAQINFKDRDAVMLGTLMHSPSFGEFSPGTLHMYFLGLALARRGVTTLDLTPGAGYKNRFATHNDQVHLLTLFLRWDVTLRHRMKKTCKRAGRKLCGLVGLEPARAVDWLSRVTRTARITHSPDALVTRRNADQRRFQVYSWTADQIRKLPPSTGVVRDRLQDLLCFKGLEGVANTMAFLKPALTKLEAGSHVFTQTENDLLLYEAWLIGAADRSILPGIREQFSAQFQSPVIYAIEEHEPGRGQESYANFVAGIIRETAGPDVTPEVYVLVRPEQRSLQHVVEKLGATFRRHIAMAIRSPESQGDV